MDVDPQVAVAMKLFIVITSTMSILLFAYAIVHSRRVKREVKEIHKALDEIKDRLANRGPW